MLPEIKTGLWFNKETREDNFNLRISFVFKSLFLES